MLVEQATPATRSIMIAGVADAEAFVFATDRLHR